MLLLAALLVSAEVVSRKLLTVVYSGSDELAAYLFAVGTTLSLAHVLVTRGHVRIDAAYLHFPLRVRAALDVLSLIVLGAVTVAMLDRCFDLTYSNFIEWNRSNTPLRTPLMKLVLTLGSYASPARSSATAAGSAPTCSA